MKTPFHTILVGLLMAAASVPLNAASTLRFAFSVFSVAENAGKAEVSVLRANDLDTAVTVNYATTGLSATAGADYTETSGTLTFGTGERAKVIAIPILNDELRESTQTLRLTLSGPAAGAVLGSPTQATLQILDNDPGVSFAQPAYFIAEQAGEIQTMVVRGNDVDLRAFTVNYATVAGGATAGADFVAQSGTLSFAAGQLSQELRIAIVNNGLPEANETLGVTLSNAVGGPSLGGLKSTQITIRDNDGGVSFGSTGMSISEDAGEAVLSVVRRDDVNLQAFTVDYATADISATAGVDYLTRSGTLNFAASQPSKELRIPILNDGLKESNKTFRVTLSNAMGGLSLGTPKDFNVTITDNDGGVHFSQATHTVPEDGGRVHLTVLRGSDVEVGPFTVDFATVDVTARAGSDYVAQAGSLSFATGQQSQDLPIEILNDGVRESMESLRVTLSQVVGAATPGTPLTATVSIESNDAGLGFEFTTYSVWETAGQVAVNVVRWNDGDLGPFTVEVHTSDLTAHAGSDYQAVSAVLAFRANQTMKQVVIPLLKDSAVIGPRQFRLTLTNATNGGLLGATTATVSINEIPGVAGAFYSLAPYEASSLGIQRDNGLNVLSWVGTGQLLRSDDLAGPWVKLASARSPYRSAPPLPKSFYRIQGSRQPADVYVPAGYDPATPMPLIILLHGYGGTGTDQDSYFGLRSLADSRRFLYCFPDGTVDQVNARFWNATDACCDFYGKGTDDALYLRQLIEEIGEVFALDRKRVHLVGHSNGGFMSYRMACEHSDLIAGIASLAGVTLVDSTDCLPSEPVNILQIHGTTDLVVPYGGGKLGGSLPKTGETPSALETVQMWAAYNRCAGPVTEPGVSMDLDLDVSGLDTVVMRYTNCPPGGAVELWTINGGSHGPTFSNGSTESEFATRVIDWLLAHPKP